MVYSNCHCSSAFCLSLTFYSNLTLTFSHWTYRKRHCEKTCDKSCCCLRIACKRARLMTSHLNIYFCRRPLQNSSLEDVAAVSHFLSVSWSNRNNFSLP